MSSPHAITFFVTAIITIAFTQMLSYFTSIDTNSWIILIQIGIVAIAIQWIVFLHASGLIFGNERTEHYFDLTGTQTFTVLILYSALYTGFQNLSVRQVIVSVSVLLWSLRLGYFLFTRCARVGSDSRFTEIKQDLFRFANVWTIQAIWTYVVCMPGFVLNSFKDNSDLDPLFWVGIGIYIFGFLIEIVADAQKNAFRANKENQGKFISTGLWSISRHPNYFGEIVLWIGLYLAACGGLTDTQKYILMVSPIFITLLIIFVTGIPILEQKSDEKWGDMIDYEEYKQKTPVLIPFIGRAGSAPF